MVQHRYLCSDTGQGREVNRGNSNAFGMTIALYKDLPPRVHDLHEISRQTC